MPRTVDTQQRQPRGSITRASIVVAIVAVLGGLLWFAGSRMRKLDHDLEVSERRAKKLNADLREYSEELDDALGRARAARSRAEIAEGQVEETTEALRSAEDKVETVTAERELARQRAAATHEEIEAMRGRRQAELDRMQEALNKIAPTKRTPAGMVMMLSEKDFRFAFDKATLTPANREKLSRVAGILLASEGYHLYVDGHTDDVGDASYNQGLSERRAKTVRDYLVGAGIPADMVDAQGFGQKQPLVKAKTKEARAMNRRVEIGIVDTIIEYQKAVKN